MDSIYRFNATLANQTPFSFKQLQGRVVLIVNTASTCNFSNQLAALERLYQDYKDQDFSVLAFPCDQFGHHEQKSDTDITEFYAQTYNVTFPIMSKTKVIGPDAHPLFNYLKTNTRGIAQNRAIKWNFTKFLINSQGQLINRYAPRTKPDTLRPVIESQLNEVSPIQLAKV